MPRRRDVLPIQSAPMTATDTESCLAANHQALVEASAIDPSVALERGYRTVTKRVDLERLGFSTRQARVPALLIPIRNVHGEIATYQIRSDVPRVKAGKSIKYETPSGAHMVLDVPSRCVRERWLEDPAVPLFITEGARKADAGVSKGLFTIALLGVWNWRGTNEHGGKLALPDWESIALNGREVYICFDSDVVTKRAVHSALARLKPFLEQRGSRVHVIYLPSASGGTKVGLDDFLAAGGGVDDLLALASDILRISEEQPRSEPFATTPDGSTIYFKVKGEDLVEERLANFTATIVETTVEDDGVEQTRYFKIEAVVAGQPRHVTVSAESFAGLNWVNEHLGPRAILSPGFGARDRMRAAIQALSCPPIPERRIYRHLGWIRHDDRDLYLHAAGAIGADGAVPEISVRLDPPLHRYKLPEPAEGLAAQDAVRASLGLLEGLASDRVLFPMFSLVWTTVIRPPRESVHLTGKTGERKTEIAALMQRHFGNEMDAANLPGSWSSTGNFLEGLAFLAKDALFTIDDFIPTGTGLDVQRTHGGAERVLRAQGNGSARGRLRSDGTPRPPRPPRGAILSTGEDVPAGHSLRARILVLDLEAGEMNLERLTACQEAADRYSQAMAVFLRWCAGRLCDLRAELDRQLPLMRDELLHQVPHGRTASAGAALLAGFSIFLRFAVAIGAIEIAKAQELEQRCRRAILEVLGRQADHQAASDPAQLFVELIAASLQSGEAHLVEHVTGGRPADEELARAGGWRRIDGESNDWRPHGPEIGRIDADEDAIYLVPTSAYRAMQKQSEGLPVRVGLSERVLWKRLREATLIVNCEPNRSTAKVRVGSRTLNLLHLSVSHLLGGTRTSRTTRTFGDEPGHGEADAEVRAIPNPAADRGEAGDVLEVLDSESLGEDPSNATARGPLVDPDGDWGVV